MAFHFPYNEFYHGMGTRCFTFDSHDSGRILHRLLFLRLFKVVCMRFAAFKDNLEQSLVCLPTSAAIQYFSRRTPFGCNTFGRVLFLDWKETLLTPRLSRSRKGPQTSGKSKALPARAEGSPSQLFLQVGILISHNVRNFTVMTMFEKVALTGFQLKWYGWEMTWNRLTCILMASLNLLASWKCFPSWLCFLGRV